MASGFSLLFCANYFATSGLILCHWASFVTPCASEQMLRGKDPVLDAYLTQFKRRLPGRGVAKFRRLLNLMRTYPREAFLAAIHQAHPYGLYDLTRLEQIILSRVAGDFFQLQLEGDEPCL